MSTPTPAVVLLWSASLFRAQTVGSQQSAAQRIFQGGFPSEEGEEAFPCPRCPRNIRNLAAFSLGGAEAREIGFYRHIKVKQVLSLPL